MKTNALKINQIRCYLSVIVSSFLVLLTFVGMLIRLFYVEGPTEGTSGIESFRMFTILSNVVASTCAMLSIPYTIDGIRTGNYHLPRWIIDTMYVGVTSTSMTFLISLCILSPVVGFVNIMFHSTSILFHTICPLLSIILFVFLDAYHNIKFYKTFIAMAPIVCYLIIYSIMVFYVKSWQDFYQFNSYMPWIVVVFLAIPVAFLIAFLLRLSHNLIHKIQKENIEKYYLESLEFDCKDINEAITILAKKDKNNINGDVIVPRRAIKILMKRFNVKEPLNVYLKEYIDKIKVD